MQYNWARQPKFEKWSLYSSYGYYLWTYVYSFNVTPCVIRFTKFSEKHLSSSAT